MRNKLLILIILLGQTNLFCQQINEYLAGVAKLQQENPTSAVEHLNSSITKDNNVARSHLYRGMAFYKLRDYKKAEEDLKIALQKNIIEASLWLAKIYALDKNPITSTTYLKAYLADVEYAEGKKVKSAKEFSNIHFSNEWFDIASAEKKPLIKSIDEGYYFLSSGDINSGIEYLNTALSEHGEEPELYKLRAQLFLENENQPLALLDLIKSLELNPEDIEVNEMLGDTYMSQGNFHKAIEHLDFIYQQFPEKFAVYLKLAKAYQLDGNLTKSELLLQEYLFYFNDDNSAKIQLADVYYESGEYTNALREVNPVLAKDQSNAEWFLLRGKCYIKTGTLKYAYHDLTMSLDLDPENNETNRLTGDLLYRQGKPDKACHFWNRASRNGDRKAQKSLIEHCQ